MPLYLLLCMSWLGQVVIFLVVIILYRKYIMSINEINEWIKNNPDDILSLNDYLDSMVIDNSDVIEK